MYYKEVNMYQKCVIMYTQKIYLFKISDTLCKCVLHIVDSYCMMFVYRTVRGLI